MRYIHPKYITSSTSLGLLLLLAAMGCGPDNSSSGEDMTTSPVEDMGMDTGQGSEEMGCQDSTCTPDQDGGDVCGDGMQTGEEECDDGNLEAGDGCDAQCREEPAQAVCGDGMQTGDEACDEGTTPPSACPYGEMSCQVCTSTCTFTAGSTAYCGDGILQQDEGETCDDGQENSEDGPCLPDCTRIVPVKVFGGAFNSYALMSNGTVYAWGDNAYGQLGDGTTELRSQPAVLPGFEDVIEIVDGTQSMCALLSNGELKCIGRGEDGELGNGLFASSNIAVTVEGLNDAIALSGYNRRYCALNSSNEVWCWGRDMFGGLGTPGDLTNQSSPIKVELPDEATSITSGVYTCALLKNEQVWCWGGDRHYYGEMDSALVDRAPEHVLDLDGAREIHGMAQTLLFKNASEELYGVGENRRNELNTSSSNVVFYEPTKIDQIESSYKIVTSGSAHACAISPDEEVFCWGNNSFRQLSEQELGVFFVKINKQLKEIGLGARHTCGIDKQNEVWCWGSNEHGQLGFAPSDELFGPQKVELWPTP